MPYTITRQRQWPTGRAVVEVSAGGIDYTNPDALSPKYSGEFETYADPEEAAQVAVDICRKWRKDGAPGARVAYGATGGMTMPFEPCSFDELRRWAVKQKERLPKCNRCGAVLPQKHYFNGDTDERYCSLRCAEEAATELVPNPEVDGDWKILKERR